MHRALAHTGLLFHPIFKNWKISHLKISRLLSYLKKISKSEELVTGGLCSAWNWIVSCALSQSLPSPIAPHQPHIEVGILLAFYFTALFCFVSFCSSKASLATCIFCLAPVAMSVSTAGLVKPEMSYLWLRKFKWPAEGHRDSSCKAGSSIQVSSWTRAPSTWPHCRSSNSLFPWTDLAVHIWIVETTPFHFHLIYPSDWVSIFLLKKTIIAKKLLSFLADFVNN